MTGNAQVALEREMCLSPRQVQSVFPCPALVPSRVEVQWQKREYFSAHDCSLLAGSASLGASCGGGFCIAVGLIPVQLANCQHKLCNLQLQKCHASICFSSHSILSNAHFQLSSPSFPVPQHSLLVSCVALRCVFRLRSPCARQSWSGGCGV